MTIKQASVTKRMMFVALLLMFAGQVQARLEVCNQTDLILMVAVGYDTENQRIATEGWWKVYPGFCEVPVDVAMLKGDYYLHAESNPKTTMPNDSFVWGDGAPLCVSAVDFRHADARLCKRGDISLKFSAVNKNWRNLNRINIVNKKRKYVNLYRARVAGVQRLLSMLGYDIGEIDGLIGESTSDALNKALARYQVFGLNFKKVYPALEKAFMQKHKLNE